MTNMYKSGYTNKRLSQSFGLTEYVEIGCWHISHVSNMYIRKYKCIYYMHALSRALVRARTHFNVPSVRMERYSLALVTYASQINVRRAHPSMHPTHALCKTTGPTCYVHIQHILQRYNHTIKWMNRAHGHDNHLYSTAAPPRLRCLKWLLASAVCPDLFPQCQFSVHLLGPSFSQQTAGQSILHSFSPRLHY